MVGIEQKEQFRLTTEYTEKNRKRKTRNKETIQLIFSALAGPSIPAGEFFYWGKPRYIIH
jgi:hypothetical protein